MKACFVRSLIALLCVLVAESAAAQDPMTIRAEAADGSDGGAFWDWIHKLSGPQYRGTALTYSCAAFKTCFKLFPFHRQSGLTSEPPFRLRATVAKYRALEDREANPSNAELRLTSVQVAGEYGLFWLGTVARAEVGAGAAWHRFTGDHPPFHNWSFPIYAQLRSRPFNHVVFTLGGGRRYFLDFENDDFGDLMITLERNKLHGGWITHLGISIQP
jgi:hypothetical protein